MGRQLTVTLPDDVADAVERTVAEQGWRDAGEYIAEAVRGWREPFTSEEEAWMIQAAEEAEADAAINGYIPGDEAMEQVLASIRARAEAYAANGR